MRTFDVPWVDESTYQMKRTPSSRKHVAASNEGEPSKELRALLMNGLALAPAGANVVMQLSRLHIGHAVAKSRVTSGALTKHPLKRTRTTLGYILVALLGDDDERAWVRREVNRQHQGVRSLEHDDVAYHAFDPELQLWVAACMYRGALDAAALVYGPASSSSLDELYLHCARFATTLQVPAARWPENRAAFDQYWQSSLTFVEVDELTRTYLRGIVSLTFLPAPLAVLLGPLHELLTAGFLPDEFRQALGLRWNEKRKRRFHLVLRVATSAHRVLPRAVREFPMNVIWWDTQRRRRRGTSFV